MNIVNLSPYHEGNLRTLADYLLRFVPTSVIGFDMKEFDSRVALHSTAVTNCGSAGCAVGHGPYANIEKCIGEDWDEYSYRVFGLHYANLGGIQWRWCFSCDWSDVDNTPRGAALRILWLLEKGLPENSESQMIGNAKLCYLDFKRAAPFVTPVEWSAAQPLEVKPVTI